MLAISDLKLGTICQINNEPYEVIWAQHVQMGRGGAILRLRLKNLISGNVLEKTLKGADTLAEADLNRRQVNFLYSDSQNFHFMTTDSYEQIDLGAGIIGDKAHFLKEGVEINLLESNDRIISVQLPIKMDFKFTAAPPGVRGNSTQGKVTKVATIETGYQLNVPLFVKEGEIIRVNTETGEYVERVS